MKEHVWYYYRFNKFRNNLKVEMNEEIKNFINDLKSKNRFIVVEYLD